MYRTLFTLLVLIFTSTSAAALKPKAATKPVQMFSSKSYIVADADGNIISQKDQDQIRPIASISKLMIGLLSVEQNLYEYLPIPSRRHVQSSIPNSIKELTRLELLMLSLVKSDNLAAQVLCENLPDCVGRMNDRAKEIGMMDTHFVEPTGLSRENVSTAKDLLKLMLVSLENPVITKISSMPVVEIFHDKKIIKVNNTNPLTSKFEVILSKTGFTSPAGGCLVMSLKSTVGKKIFILLGSKNTRTRISDMEILVKQS